MGHGMEGRQWTNAAASDAASMPRSAADERSSASGAPRSAPKANGAVYAGTLEGLRGLISRVGSGTTLAELRAQANVSQPV